VTAPGPDTGTTPPVTVVCPTCAGLTFVVGTCRCVDGGDRYLVEWDAQAGRPWRDCRVCQGLGRAATGCGTCDQKGRRRAQLVLTVANLDTGAVASRQVTPGTLDPAPHPDGGWCLRLAAVLRDLAATVGAGTLHDVRRPGRPVGDLAVTLPRWRPDLPAGQRYAVEAYALAGWSHDPWWVFLGRTAAPTPPDPARDLGRLCQVADLLRLDLVVEARREPWGTTGWDVRYDLPGADVPVHPRHRGDDLPTALAATTVTDALDGLAERGRHAPAYTVEPGPPDRAGAPAVDPDQVERRLLGDLADAPGAQAVWRDGRWWHTTLRPAGTVETFTDRDTGQVARRAVTALRRAWQPPPPSWLGRPIGHDPCPDCDPGSRLRRCACTLGGRAADPDCARCSGAGTAPSALPCHTCGDSGRLYRAVAVTVTDLAHRVAHHTWEPAPDVDAPVVATTPGGRPVRQLPARYRLGRWAPVFGVRPGDLTELDSGHEVGQDLRDGYVTPAHPGVDPVTGYVEAAGRGLPGARLLVLAAVPDAPALPVLVRLAHGLGLGVLVTVADRRHHHGDPLRVAGVRWGVEVVPAGDPTGRLGPPLRPTVEAAVAYCLRYLELAVAGAVPADPGRPVPAPNAPPGVVDDPVPWLLRLAAHHAGEAVSAYLDRAGCRLFLHERGGARQLAQAATLADAMTALRLSVTPPRDNESRQ
jgi:hypothetical protein